MPAQYPAAAYSPRTKANKVGVVYAPAETTKIFAEDIQKLDDEVVALENSLPLTTAKTFLSATYGLELEEIQSKYAFPCSYLDFGTVDPGKRYFGAGTITNINFTMNGHVAAGDEIKFVLLKNGANAHTPIVLDQNSSLSNDIPVSINVADGDYFSLKIYREISFENKEYIGSITITGTKAEAKDEILHLNSVLEFLNQKNVQVVVATANQIINNSSALADSTYLKTNLQSGHLYAFEIYLAFNLKANSDVKFKIETSNSEDELLYKRAGDLPTTEPSVGSTTNTILVSAPGKFTDILKGHIYGAYGYFYFKIRWAQNTATVEDTTLLKGSYIKLIDLGLIS